MTVTCCHSSNSTNTSYNSGRVLGELRGLEKAALGTLAAAEDGGHRDQHAMLNTPPHRVLDYMLSLHDTLTLATQRNTVSPFTPPTG